MVVNRFKKDVVEGVRVISTQEEFEDTSDVMSNRMLKHADVYFKGESFPIPLTSDILSKHVLFMGGIGTGKTNGIFQIVDQIIDTMTNDDVMVVFDSKGDFLQEFGPKTKDPAIISSGPESNVFWNMFNEAIIDYGKELDETMDENLMELATSIFGPMIEKDKTNPFFPLAARNIFYSILYYMYMTLISSHMSNGMKYINNSSIYVNSKKSSAEIVALLRHPRCKDKLEQMIEYLGSYQGGEFMTSPQGLSVIATMRNELLNVFSGNFVKPGDFSIRKFVRSKGARVLFIEYDLSRGRVLSPIYKTLMDMAIKESLCRNRSKGNVYFVIDEFRLLPKLDYMDTGVNLGRSLGSKFIVGMQNIKQIESIYGESESKSILSGFLTTANFRTTDKETREYICGQFGKNRFEYEVKTLNGGKQLSEGEAVSDNDILSLDVGESIIGVPMLNFNPIRFKFKEYTAIRK